MARTLHADLLTTQQLAYFSPAFQCIFKDKSGATVADYSFDPTVTTNRLEGITHYEEPFDTGDPESTIILRNNDVAVPELREISPAVRKVTM